MLIKLNLTNEQAYCCLFVSFLRLFNIAGSGNGKCIEGNCVCQDGFHGKDCSEKNCPNNWYNYYYFSEFFI